MTLNMSADSDKQQKVVASLRMLSAVERKQSFKMTT